LIPTDGALAGVCYIGWLCDIQFLHILTTLAQYHSYIVNNASLALKLTYFKTGPAEVQTLVNALQYWFHTGSCTTLHVT